MRQLFTVPEAAKLLRITPNRIRDLVHEGRLRAVKLTKRFLFTQESLDELLEKSEALETAAGK